MNDGNVDRDPHQMGAGASGKPAGPGKVAGCLARGAAIVVVGIIFMVLLALASRTAGWAVVGMGMAALAAGLIPSVRKPLGAIGPLKMTGIALILVGLITVWFVGAMADSELEAKAALALAERRAQAGEVLEAIEGLETSLEEITLSKYSDLRKQMVDQIAALKSRYAQECEPTLTAAYEEAATGLSADRDPREMLAGVEALIHRYPNWLLYQSEPGEKLLKLKVDLTSVGDRQVQERYLAEMDEDAFAAFEGGAALGEVEKFELPVLNEIFAAQFVTLRDRGDLTAARQAGQDALRDDLKLQYRDALAQRNERLKGDKPRDWKKAAKSIMQDLADTKELGKLTWVDETLIDWTAAGHCLIGATVKHRDPDGTAEITQQYLITLKVDGDQVIWTKGVGTAPVDDFDEPAMQVMVRLLNDWPKTDSEEVDLDFSEE